MRYFCFFLNSFPNLNPRCRISWRPFSAKNKSYVAHNFFLASYGLNSSLSCLTGIIYFQINNFNKSFMNNSKFTCLISDFNFLLLNSSSYWTVVFSYSRDFLSKSLTIRQTSVFDSPFNGFGNLLFYYN